MILKKFFIFLKNALIKQLEKNEIVEIIEAIKDLVTEPIDNIEITILIAQSYLFYQNLPYSKLKYASREYFEKFFRETFRHIEFSAKKEATQIGLLIDVYVVNEEKAERFFAKTQRMGTVKSEIGTIHLSRTSRLDLKELFGYAMLFHLGLGPKVHFFGLDSKDFYICTEEVKKFVSF